MGYTELHFHLLPGIDDGPGTMTESVDLARAAAAEGTRTIVATPHVHEQFVTDPTTLPARVEAVAEALHRARVPIEVICGGEVDVRMVSRLSDEQLEVIAHGPAGHRWVLLEAPLTGVSEEFAAAATELRARGFAAVIAHPERSLVRARTGWRIIEAEVAAGSALQVNAWSVAGMYGDRVRLHALQVIGYGAVSALASDAHGRERLPALRMGLRTLAAVGVDRPERLAADIPRLLLEEGLSIPAARVAA